MCCYDCAAGGTQLRTAQGPAVHTSEPDFSSLAHGREEVRSDFSEFDRGTPLREGDSTSGGKHARRFVHGSCIVHRQPAPDPGNRAPAARYQ